MPMPGTARLFGTLNPTAPGRRDGIEIIDNREGFWLACLADGSLELVKDEAEDDLSS